MTTVDFITELFYSVDNQMRDVPKHPQSNLYPSELVTIALLFAIKGVGERAFYRWLARDYLPLFPRLPERTRLFRLLKTHQDWTARFLADPTVLGVADSYGLSWYIRCVKAVVQNRLVRKANRIIAGLLAANSALS